MLHAKFQNHRPSGSEKVLKVFAIYSHGDYFGHVTLTIYTTFHSLFLTLLYKKIGQAVKEMFEYYGHIPVYSPDQGQTCKPLGTFLFININLLSINAGHLGHFRPPFLRMFQMKFGFDWPSGFREEVFMIIMVIQMACRPSWVPPS